MLYFGAPGVTGGTVEASANVSGEVVNPGSKVTLSFMAHHARDWSRVLWSRGNNPPCVGPCIRTVPNFEDTNSLGACFPQGFTRCRDSSQRRICCCDGAVQINTLYVCMYIHHLVPGILTPWRSYMSFGPERARWTMIYSPSQATSTYPNRSLSFRLSYKETRRSSHHDDRWVEPARLV